MLIKSQDRKQIVNLENVTMLSVEEKGKAGLGHIYAETTAGNLWHLGTYSSEEHAQRVIDSILEAYEAFQESRITGCPGSFKGVYLMPRDTGTLKSAFLD